MNFQQIRAFHLVAQEGTVRGAAEVMGISQPTVSQHLKGLETRHRVRLFDKRGRGLALTEAGTELFTVTKRLIETAGEVDDLLQKNHRRANGRLRVISDAPAIAVRIVAEVLRVSPDLDISIRKASVDGVVTALAGMEADIGVAVEPPIGSTLQIMPLRREELLACLPANSPLAGHAIFDMQRAADQTLILRERGSRTRALVERALATENIASPRLMEVEGTDIVREAVAHGLGLSFFAESECPPDPRLAYRPVSAKHGPIGFVEHIIMRRDRRNVPEIAAFVRAAEVVRVPSLSQAARRSP